MDLKILIWFHETFHNIGWLNHFVKTITYLGESGAIAIVCAIIFLCIKKARWAGVAIALALIFDVITVDAILKNAVARPRPWREYAPFVDFYNSINLHVPSSYSFPSGHTASSFCAAVVLLLFYRAKAIPALVVAVIIGLTRMYLCVHYPTDVLMGAVIGTCLACGAYFLTVKVLRPKFEKYYNAKKAK